VAHTRKAITFGFDFVDPGLEKFRKPQPTSHTIAPVGRGDTPAVEMVYIANYKAYFSS